MKDNSTLKSTIRILTAAPLWLLLQLSRIWKRSPNLWAFGSQKNTFSDNTKHLFIHSSNNIKNIKCAWISSDKRVILEIRRNGLVAYHRWGIKGLLFTLRSKYWFITTTTNEINHFTSANATVINLWHGIPLKKIYFDSDNEEDIIRYQHPSILQRHIIEPFTYRISNYVISTSQKVIDECLTSALKIQRDHCLPFGQPRTDILLYSPEARAEWTNKWCSNEQKELLKRIKLFEYTYIYMPTWRDHNPEFLENLMIDFKQIDIELQNRNRALLIKLHQYTPTNFINIFSELRNILILPSKDDIYPILPECDALITDYSSIALDFLLLDKPIFYFCFDLDDYKKKSRGLYYDYDLVSPGEKIATASDFPRIFSTSLMDRYQDHRRQVRDLFHESHHTESCPQIQEYFAPDPI